MVRRETALCTDAATRDSWDAAEVAHPLSVSEKKIKEKDIVLRMMPPAAITAALGGT